MGKMMFTKRLPVIVEFDELRCSDACPQLHHYVADDGYSQAQVCGYYSTRMMHEKYDICTYGRCAGCIQDFGTGEQPEEQYTCSRCKNTDAFKLSISDCLHGIVCQQCMFIEWKIGK